MVRILAGSTAIPKITFSRVKFSGSSVPPIELPGHRVERADVVGLLGCPFTEARRVGKRQTTGNRPAFRDDGLQVLALLLGGQLQEGQHRPHQRDHEHQHHRAQRGERRAEHAAPKVLQNQNQVFHGIGRFCFTVPRESSDLTALWRSGSRPTRPYPDAARGQLVPPHADRG